MKKPNLIKDKSFAFALRIVKLNKFLIEKKEIISAGAKWNRTYILAKKK